MIQINSNLLHFKILALKKEHSIVLFEISSPQLSTLLKIFLPLLKIANDLAIHAILFYLLQINLNICVIVI